MTAAVDQAHSLNRLTGAHAGSIEGIERAMAAGIDMLIHCSFYDPKGRFCFRPDIAREIADRGIWVNPTLHIRRVRVWRLQALSQERQLTPVEADELATQQQFYEQ